MSDTDLISLSPDYAIAIDGAGFGTINGGRKVLRRPAICNYLVSFFTSGALSIDYLEPVEGPLLWILPPNVERTYQFIGQGTVWWTHFTVRTLPGWHAVDHRLEFGLSHPNRQQFIQPSFEAVYGYKAPIILPPEGCLRWQAEFPDIVGNWLERTPTGRMKARLQFSELWHTFVRAHIPDQEHHNQSPEKRLERAETLARRCMGKNTTVQELAEIAGYHRAHFTALFQEHRGISPRTFLRRLRLEEARVLLTTQNMSITDIALSVDYPNHASFSRAFREEYGISPSDWRAKQKS